MVLFLGNSPCTTVSVVCTFHVLNITCRMQNVVSGDIPISTLKCLIVLFMIELHFDYYLFSVAKTYVIVIEGAL